MGASAQHWLNRARAGLYSGGLFAAFLFVALYLALFQLRHGFHSSGRPLGFDFVVYWGASRLALAGNAVAAYDPQALFTALRASLPSLPGTPPWVYPPTFQLLLLPLGLLPYFASYAAFMILTFAAYAAVLWRILPSRHVVFPLLGFPAVWINLLQGQNGFLTAALAGGTLLLLPRRPLAAGALAGLLGCKPQLALLLPLALLAGRHWRALAAAALASLALVALSTAVLGYEVVPAFLTHAAGFAAASADDIRLLGKNPSFFAFARLLGAPLALAAALQVAVAGAVAAAMVRVWKHCRSAALRNAALTAGSLLVSPYLLNYDLAWLALSLAWLCRDCVQHGWLRWERELMAAVWLLPLAMSGPYALLRLQLAPFVVLALLLAILRRVNRCRTSAHPPSTACDPSVAAR